MTNDELYALRLHLMEFFDENKIISILKKEILNSGMSEDDTNIYLYSFYYNNDINVNIQQIIDTNVVNNLNEDNDEISTIEDTIESTHDIDELQITISNLELNPIQRTHNIEESIENNIQDDNSINSEDERIINEMDISNIFRLMNNFVSSEYNNTNFNDVVCTLGEVEKLKTYNTEKELDQCKICLDVIEINTEVIELPCCHIYHSNCINEWLMKYNYKCPTCRIEVGKPKYNL
jgi:hypothetical protein